MNQASYSNESLPYSPNLMLPEPHSHLDLSMGIPYNPCDDYSASRPKNVPEELKMFLMTHGDQWYTNEQLAEHLNQYVFFSVAKNAKKSLSLSFSLLLISYSC